MTVTDCIKERKSIRKFTEQPVNHALLSEIVETAAYKQGLGTVTLGIFDDLKVSEILNIPDDREVIALMSIGYPAEKPVAPRRKPVDELLSYL